MGGQEGPSDNKDKRFNQRSKSLGKMPRKSKLRKSGPSGHANLARSIRPNHMADLDRALESVVAHRPHEGSDNMQTSNVKDSRGKAAALISHEALRGEQDQTLG